VQDHRSLFGEYTPWADPNAVLDALRAGDAMVFRHDCADSPDAEACWYLSALDHLNASEGEPDFSTVTLCQACQREARKDGAYVYPIKADWPWRRAS
jgi:hypothetical protein